MLKNQINQSKFIHAVRSGVIMQEKFLDALGGSFDR